jgi:hypothetical protein
MVALKKFTAAIEQIFGAPPKGNQPSVRRRNLFI